MKRAPRVLNLITMGCLLCILSACLSRPERHQKHYPRKGTSKPGKTIPTDASTGRGLISPSGNLLVDYAKLMGVSPMALKNPQLYSFIQPWLGSPHQMGGMVKKGVDCSGFTYLVYSHVYGKVLPRTSYDMSRAIKRKKETKLEEGDLVFFSFGGSTINHVGIYLQNQYFVHVSTSKGVIISRLSDPWYEKYFVTGGAVL